MLNHAVGRARQRGMSLVELMVGIAVGMFVVAAAATLVTTQLVDNRRLLQEVQLQQDLRATADIITRDLRRASATNKVTDTVGQMWDPGNPAWVQNSMLDITLPTPDNLEFRNGRANGSDGPYGYQLRQVDGQGVIYSELGPQGWQPLTDGSVINITSFAVTAQPEPALVVPCPKICPDGTQNCWPRVTVRRYAISIRAQAVGDASIQRSFSSVARIRNDRVTSDPANLPGFCPA